MVVEIPTATSTTQLNGTIVDAWQRPLGSIDIRQDGWDGVKDAKYLRLPSDYKRDVPAGYKPVGSCTYLQNFFIRSISTIDWNAAVECGHKIKV